MKFPFNFEFLRICRGWKFSAEPELFSRKPEPEILLPEPEIFLPEPEPEPEAEAKNPEFAQH